MQLKKREAEKAFAKLRMHVKFTHHKMGTFLYEDKPILRTRVSFGKGDVPGNVVDKLRGQLKLNEQQFRELVRCPIGYEEYVEILKAKGYIGDA
jgi:hypothetical protein